LTANALSVPEEACAFQAGESGKSEEPAAWVDEISPTPGTVASSAPPETPADAEPGVVVGDEIEAFRSLYRAERGRILTHPEMCARLDTHRLAVDSGEHRAAVEVVHASARADGLATRRAFFMALYARAHIDGLVVRRTHAQIAEDMAPFLGREVSARTVAGLAREAHRNHLMVTLEGGLSPAAHAKLGGRGARVPLYALTVPSGIEGQLTHRTPHGKGTARPVDEVAYLPRPAVSPEKAPSAVDYTPAPVGPSRDPVDEVAHPNRGLGRSRYSPRPTGRRERPGTSRKTPPARRGKNRPPKTSGNAVRLATALAVHPTLRKISNERRARLMRPFARAGWSPADIRHALEHAPNGTQHRHSDAVRHPWSWAAYRLGLWLAQGRPVTSWSQRQVPGWVWSGESAFHTPESWDAERAVGPVRRGEHQPNDAYRAAREFIRGRGQSLRRQQHQRRLQADLGFVLGEPE